MADQGNEYILDSGETVNSEFRLYNPNDNRDTRLASQYDKELNRIISAPSTIYFLDDKPFDTLYGEDTSPQYGPPYSGVIGFYQPNPVDYQLNRWGIDSAGIDMLIMFNKEELNESIPREIDVGDLVVDIYNRIYEVMYTKNDSNFRFEFITQYVLCKRRLGDLPSLIGRTTDMNKENRTVKQEPDPLYGE